MNMTTTYEVVKGLSGDELSTLEQCEQQIKRGLKTFVEVGTALQTIRDGRLYREQYATFDEYCRERWNMSRIHAHRTIEAAEVAGMLPVGNTITSERQARELAPLNDDPTAMTKAVEQAEVKAKSEGRKVTSTDLKQSVASVRGEGGHASVHKDDHVYDSARAMAEIKKQFKSLRKSDKRSFLGWTDGIMADDKGGGHIYVVTDKIISQIKRLYTKGKPSDHHHLTRELLHVASKRDPQEYSLRIKESVQ